jgi:hypothetical protein
MSIYDEIKNIGPIVVGQEYWVEPLGNNVLPPNFINPIIPIDINYDARIVLVIHPNDNYSQLNLRACKLHDVITSEVVTPQLDPLVDAPTTESGEHDGTDPGSEGDSTE